MTNNQLWALYAKYFAKPCALIQILDRQGTNAEQDTKKILKYRESSTFVIDLKQTPGISNPLNHINNN